MTDEVVVNYDKLETRADRGAGTPLEIMLAHGFSVGPLDGKVPLTRHGVQDFTRDRDVIARWTRQYPGCNWGCTQAGIVQLDIDPRNGGRVADLQLRPEHETLTIRTGSGGWHFHYRYSGPVRGRVLDLDGIDIKCGGKGYVVAPGSVHPTTGKLYTLWRDAPIANLPAHLQALIAQPTFAPPSATSGSGSSRVVDRWTAWCAPYPRPSPAIATECCSGPQHEPQRIPRQPASTARSRRPPTVSASARTRFSRPSSRLNGRHQRDSQAA